MKFDRLNELIEEKYWRNRSVIVVDVQPEYVKDWYVAHNIIKFVLNQKGKVLMFVNAEKDGLTSDTVDSIKKFWIEHNNHKKINWKRFEINDKGYGYLRGWMDSGWSDRVIIKTIRKMYQEGVIDSRMLFGGEDSETYAEEFEDFIGREFDEYMLREPLITYWTSLSQLKRFNNSYIVGGSRNQCLREVELLMNAFNIRYKRIDSMVYD